MTRIALVDDHVLFVQALTIALENLGFDVVALAPSQDLSAEIAGADVDLVLLDLALGGGLSGLDVLPALVGHAPVVVLTGETDRDLWGECLLAGAQAVLEKNLELDVIGAVVTAAAHKEPLPSQYADVSWVRSAWERRAALAPFESLSTRESQVLGALMSGRSAAEIAADAYVTEATVRTQIRAVLTKLDVSSQLQAVAKARACGWPAPGAVPVGA
jgi:DNA-binding NarL/FixJ family response regulator